jgi:hypothetical protein
MRFKTTKMTEIPGKPDVNPASSAFEAEQVRNKVLEAIASLEAQGIRDWQILSTWSQLLHEQDDFEKGEVLSMATQMLVEIEGRVRS